MNGILPILKKLQREFHGEFLITKEVKSEIIDYPVNLKKYELEALQMKQLFDEGVIKHADITEEQIENLRKIRDNLMNVANNTFFADGKSLHLLDKGESATLALSKILDNSPIVIDERTTRMLCENPENLRKLFEKKFHTKVTANKKNYEFFKDFKIIRSAELAYLAHKKGFYEIKDERILDAMLYALKLRGCSISEYEINEMKKM